MNQMTARGFKANISVETNISPESTVKEIEELLSIILKKNETGKFEEFVGYEGTALGISVNLIFDPADKSSPVDLDIYGSSNVDGSFADITDFILALLSKSTQLRCRRMI